MFPYMYEIILGYVYIYIKLLLYTLYHILPLYIVYILMEQFCRPFMYMSSFIYIILYNTLLYSLHLDGTILSAIYNFFYIHYTIYYPYI